MPRLLSFKPQSALCLLLLTTATAAAAPAAGKLTLTSTATVGGVVYSHPAITVTLLAAPKK
jgi:phage tail sheath gpL-like